MPRSLRYLSLLLLLGVGACTTTITPYKDDRGRMTVFSEKPLATETGMASWYHDRRTASGERLDWNALTAAHKHLPFNSHVRVIDLKTNHSIIVRVNDRGPYVRGRIIDLTPGGAKALGIFDRGVAKVRIEVLKEIPLMTATNLHSTPEQIKHDREMEAKVKAAMNEPMQVTKPGATTHSGVSHTHRRHTPPTHRTSSTSSTTAHKTSTTSKSQ